MLEEPRVGTEQRAQLHTKIQFSMHCASTTYNTIRCMTLTQSATAVYIYLQGQLWIYTMQFRTQQHVKTMQPHTESMSIHSFTQAWAHRHRQTVHTISFLWILPHLELYQTICLIMHMLHCLATLYFCISRLKRNQECCMWDMVDVNNIASAWPIFKAVSFSLLLADKNRKWQNVHSSEAMSLCFPVVASFF